jgi:hypothetical protein
MQLIQKTRSELLRIAADLNIKGRSRMDKEQLGLAIWEKIYGKGQDAFIPKNNDECIDFLILHPSVAVNVLTKLWMTVGGTEIIRALNLIAKCRSAVIYEEMAEEDEAKKTIVGPPVFQEMVRTCTTEIYNGLCAINHNLNQYELRFHAELTLANWNGSILCFVPLSDERSLGEKPALFEIVFVEHGQPKPENMCGWIVLEEEELSLSKRLIAEHWPLNFDKEGYLITKHDVENLRNYLHICKSAKISHE